MHFSAGSILWGIKSTALLPHPQTPKVLHSSPPRPYLSAAFRSKGVQSESLPAQQTHSSVLNPSILGSQGFQPEIPLTDKPNTAQKGAKKAVLSFLYILLDPCCSGSFWNPLATQTVTKSKTPRGLCYKLARIWGMEGWSCHCCLSHIREDVLSFLQCLFSVRKTPMFCWQGANLPSSLVVSFSRVQRKAPVEWLLCLLLAASPHWEAVLIVWASVLSPAL